MHRLTGEGAYRVLEARSHPDAVSMMDHEEIDIVFIDFEKIVRGEMDLVSYARTRLPQAEIVILAMVTQLDEATAALRNGASFYLVKPIKPDDLGTILEKTARRMDRRREHLALEQQVLSDLMAGNPAMQKVLKLTTKIAPTSSTVLIGGESGTGKEFFARVIHRMSGRIDGRFVAMNCGSVPDTLFESELFGHRKGAFTGADRDKPGLVEEANLGTLFLDEVGELSPMAQVKLLRFLQERTFRRIGENTLRSVNVRIVAATNKELTEKIRHGSFREDLFYRLNVFYLFLPPLRERKETIPSLLKLFVHRCNRMLGKRVEKIARSAEIVLANYDYPGNVRELENIVEHAVVLAEGGEITENDLPEFMFGNRLLLTGPSTEATKDDGEIPTLKEMERRHIVRALALVDNNYTRAAEKLGVSRSTLWRKLKEHDIGKQGSSADGSGRRVT